jgi:hypothetical protein
MERRQQKDKEGKKAVVQKARKKQSERNKTGDALVVFRARQEEEPYESRQSIRQPATQEERTGSRIATKQRKGKLAKEAAVNKARESNIAEARSRERRKGRKPPTIEPEDAKRAKKRAASNLLIVHRKRKRKQSPKVLQLKRPRGSMG